MSPSSPLRGLQEKKLQFHWLVYMSSSFTRCITRYSTTAKQPSEFYTSFDAARQFVRTMRLASPFCRSHLKRSQPHLFQEKSNDDIQTSIFGFDINDSL